MRAVLTFSRRFFRELLLQSGQFALFYLLMRFSMDGLGLFSDVGHTALLGILAFQTALLVVWGDRPWLRFLGSLAAPVCYSLLEGFSGSDSLLNAAHAGFWLFSLATGTLQALALKTRRLPVRAALEFVLTVLNVAIFFVLYFYFDTLMTVKDVTELSLGKIFTYFPQFLSDPTHVYVLLGGILLAFGLALGRTEILRLKDRINTLFGQYVDQEIRDEILAGQGTRAREVDLAVLFSDLRNFTACSEEAAPQAVTQMLNLYFSEWTEVVRRHGGVVDKFIGDAIMILFGLKGGAACDQAVACGREMLSRWPALRDRLESSQLPVPDGLGIGLHWGPTLLGDIGSEERRNFTVIGDTVNTASRLEAACKSTGKSFLVSEEVRSRLSNEKAALCAPLGPLKLRGKEQPLQVWSVEN